MGENSGGEEQQGGVRRKGDSIFLVRRNRPLGSEAM